MKLQFYRKGIPINIIKRIIVLVITFFISVIFFEIVTNIKEDVEVTAQGSPTLPTLAINYFDDGQTILHGYVNEMDPAYMRDALIPLDSDRNISLSISEQGYEIDSLSYAIKSLDTERNISSNEIDFKKEGDVLLANITAENLIDVGEEYLLVITATSGSDSIYYYTRIMQTENCHEKEILDFAQYFHDTALSANYSELASYIEPDGSMDDSDLSHVTINSSLSQVGYGSFDGIQTGTPRVSFTDITTNYVSLTIDYELTRGSDSKTEYYLCSEDFRIRYTADRIYLLSYDRSMEQILDSASLVIEDNMLNIGVTNQDVQYLSNETGTVVSFVQSGSLFEYNQADRNIKEIFSFVNDPTDIRSIYNQHEIMILNIDESGTMDYVVYGYMNSGTHEGECGINLYHYDAITNVSTEQVFITSSSSYQILNANFSDLLYETADNEFYIMVNGTLLYIPLNNELSTTELMTGLDDSQYAVSSSRRYMAWMDDATLSDSLHIFDLETNNSFDINAEDGQLLKPLAFMDDDLIYGIIYEKDITTDGAGSTVYPMYKIVIADISNGSSSKELMSYQKSGYYITDVNIDGYTIYMDRIQFSDDNTILEADMDTIKNSAGEQNKAVPITTENDSIKQRCIVLNMAPFEEDETLGNVTFDVTGLVVADSNSSISVASATSSTQYFVYVGNRVTLATDNLIEAISEADANMGIVLDNEPKYIWKRGRKNYQSALTGITVGSSDSDASGLARALSAMLVNEGENVQVHTLIESGETPISILSRTLKDETILDLTGASISQVLYYVNLGHPVYAYTGDDTAVLVVGYDANSVTLFNPMTLKNTKMGLTEADEYFSSFGNVFVSYID
ncbi:MAG: hypothetical protein K6E79_04950 [Pseudobutyrivibrio sp.]|nr:hypothetical protein [Pseudobutyrivibrio sp.]